MAQNDSREEVQRTQVWPLLLELSETALMGSQVEMPGVRQTSPRVGYQCQGQVRELARPPSAAAALDFTASRKHSVP